MKKRKTKVLKQLVRMMRPDAMVKTISHKKIMVDFADKYGLVYFGHVDQHSDEHRMVRGLTASPTHRDNHYCIGSVEDHDIVAVERQAEIEYPGKPRHVTTWTILAVDLKPGSDLPHVFLDSGPRNEAFYANLFTKFARLKETDLSNLVQRDDGFLSKYTTFTPTDRVLEVERLLAQDVTYSMGQYFTPLDIEIEADTLYLYADNMPLTPELLDAMLKNGLWLASRLSAVDVAAADR